MRRTKKSVRYTKKRVRRTKRTKRTKRSSTGSTGRTGSTSKSKRSIRRIRRTSLTRHRYMRGGNTLGQPIPSASGGEIAANNNANAQSHNDMNNMLKGGAKKRQRGGGVALCPPSFMNGPTGYGYVAPTGCLGPVPAAQDPSAQDGLITAFYSKAVNAANAAFDDAK